MRQELLQFIRTQQLAPFPRQSVLARQKNASSDLGLKTADTRAVYTKVIRTLSKNFSFEDTHRIWKFFSGVPSKEILLQRQQFFQSLPRSISLLSSFQLRKTRALWKPSYQSIVVTEDESTFMHLQQLDCPVQFITGSEDISSLEEYDVVQIIACEQFLPLLEQLPQAIFLNSIDEVYLERYLILLSEWKETIMILAQQPKENLISEVVSLIEIFLPLLKFIEEDKKPNITRERIELALETINASIEDKLQAITLAGTEIVALLRRSQLPREIGAVVQQAIASSGLPEQLFTKSIPVSIDEHEAQELIRTQELNVHGSHAAAIRRHSIQLRKIPELLEQFSATLVLNDFIAGIAPYLHQANSIPLVSSTISLEYSENILLETPKPITFYLTEQHRCSILTGANSGGKTTLLEHLIQSAIVMQLGLPTRGNVQMPIFSAIYYFAKNKGSMNKGAFETLLSQLATIVPESNTLILADELEAVTEPGVAGLIVSATAQYFLDKNCFLAIATHLGQEIQTILPSGARIDGIEARGLDENFELIVDHNPIIGKLAHSTPELIIEKLAHVRDEDYLKYLHQYLQKMRKNEEKDF